MRRMGAEKNVMENIDSYDKMSVQEKWYVLAMVANLYYNNNLTQSQIADRIYTSRSKVSRLLKEARDLEIVEIHIHEMWERDLEYEQIIQDKFGLKNIRVIKMKDKGTEDGMKRLGEVAAYYLDSVVRKNMIIGISRGNTLYNIVKCISAKNRKNIPITVVPIMGAVQVNAPERDSIDLTKNLALAYGGKYQYIYAPLFVSKAELRESLIQDESISNVLKMAKNAELVLTSVGSVADRSWSNYLREDVWKILENKGVVGYMGGHFYDSNGREIRTSLRDRMIGVDIEDLKKCKDVICVVYGEKKADAVLGALRGGLINTLLIDDGCAEKVCEKLQVVKKEEVLA